MINHTSVISFSFAILPQARVWIERWIADIDQEFDFILITERFDVSLAVLMIKFCWDIDDVVYIRLNRQVRLVFNMMMRGLLLADALSASDWSRASSS